MQPALLPRLWYLHSWELAQLPWLWESTWFLIIVRCRHIHYSGVVPYFESSCWTKSFSVHWDRWQSCLMIRLYRYNARHPFVLLDGVASWAISILSRGWRVDSLALCLASRDAKIVLRDWNIRLLLFFWSKTIVIQYHDSGLYMLKLSCCVRIERYY